MRGFKVYLTIGTVLILVYVVAQFNKPVPTNWSPTYRSTDKIPYGTFILRNRINDISPKATVTSTKLAAYNTLKNKSFSNSAYLIVAQKIELSDVDISQMKKFMQTGNDIFIASYDFGKLSKALKFHTSSAMRGGRLTLNFTNPTLKTEASYGFDRGVGTQYFSRIDNKKAIVLGLNNYNEPNFIQYRFGKGSLFLIAEPGFYTNFILLDKYGAEYAAKTLSYIQHTKQFIFDDYFSAQKSETTDVLRVFFKHPELKWAYYLSIFGLIIFVLYEVKRRQRIIPVADPMKNSSIEFVNVVGSVYYHQRDNLDIAKKKINYFLEHLRSRYFIKTNDIDPGFSTLLIEKTGINEPSAKTLTRLFIQIKTLNSMSDHELIILNQSIESFYKNTQGNGTGTRNI